MIHPFQQVVTRSEGKLHTLKLRDVKTSEAGEVTLTAKDFKAKAKLNVNGMFIFATIHFNNSVQ